MEWQKAKNIIIVFLIMLNAILLLLVNSESERMTLSADQYEAIEKVLSRENISLYSNITAIDYSPKKRIEFQAKELDHQQVAGLFFEDIQNLDQRIVDGRYIYNRKYNDYEYLTIYNSSFEYDNYNENSDIIIDFSMPPEDIIREARAITEAFITSMGDLAKGFELDVSHYVAGDFVNAVYRYKYKDTMVYPNEISFKVSASGIRNIEYTYFEPIGYDGDKRELFSPDEALMRFMMSPPIGETGAIIINTVDSVYYWSPDDQENDVLYGVPCYRIYYLAQGNIRNDFIIDAYTNEVK